MLQLFVSDLHLEDSRPNITRAFFHLLDTMKTKISELFLLGDIFEVWLGDDTPSQCAEALAQHLAKLAEYGVRVYLMHGNRDFLIGDAFATKCGATLIQEPYQLSVAGMPAILLHGDVLCTRDTDYLAFRRMVRDERWQQAFLEKSLTERVAIGNQLRNQSKKSAQKKADYIMDVTDAEVVALLEQTHSRLMIHGHTHRPATHVVQLPDYEARRIVLGDWYTQGWYILADQENVKLYPHRFPHAPAQ